jgi:hypothetical protein
MPGLAALPSGKGYKGHDDINGVAAMTYSRHAVIKCDVPSKYTGHAEIKCDARTFPCRMAGSGGFRIIHRRQHRTLRVLPDQFRKQACGIAMAATAGIILRIG